MPNCEIGGKAFCKINEQKCEEFLKDDEEQVSSKFARRVGMHVLFSVQLY